VAGEEGLSILVHAAGVTGAQGKFHEIDDDGWVDTLTVDLLAPVRLTRAVLPSLRRGGWGRIVYLTSEDAVQPYDDELPYCAAKAGVLAFAKGLSQTYAEEGLLVNCVSPAFIRTPMTDAMMDKRAEERGTSFEEAVETTKVFSVVGMLTDGQALVTHRPFRSPHHTISDAGLIGGGHIPRPGEVSLAHNGVLFLDELPEFPRQVLEALRQPLENGEVAVSRANHRITYPARFMLVAAMNPCRCGHAYEPGYACKRGRVDRCTSDYQMRISGPLMDRIDLRIEVDRSLNCVRKRSSFRITEPGTDINSRILIAFNRDAFRTVPDWGFVFCRYLETQ